MLGLSVNSLKERERKLMRKKGRKGQGGVVCETETEICILMVLMCASR